MSIDEQLQNWIDERVDAQLPRLVAEALKRKENPSPWMNEVECAEYLRLFKDGEVTVASIRNWTSRPEDKNPLPCGMAGEMRRYHRDDVDNWLREEARRNRGNSKRGRRKEFPKAVNE